MVVGCVGTGYVLRVELPIQRRLCLIFVRDVGSPDIHKCFHGLTGSQRTLGIWGVTDIIEEDISIDSANNVEEWLSSESQSD